jgi:capsular exopolysaccharide synthesis family protein
MSQEKQKLPFNQEMGEFESQSLKRDLFRYLKYWKWILFGVIISLSVSHIYLRYAPRIYLTNAKIKILKKKDSGLDLSGLTGNAPLFDMSTINLQNEIQIIQSRRIIGQVVDNLHLETYYFTTGRVKENELYGSQVPFKVSWLNDEIGDMNLVTNEIFIYKHIDNESFRLKLSEKPYDKKFNYGEEISFKNIKFVIRKNPLYKGDYNRTENIKFTYKKQNGLINYYLNKISTEPAEQESEILEMKLSGENPEKNEDLINELIKVFNEDGIRDDRRVAERTVKFVTERLASIESELDSVETNLVDFKRSEDFIDISNGTGTIFNTYSEAEQKKSDLQNQLQISRFFQEEIKNNSTYSLLPGSNSGLGDENANALIGEYNALVQQRNKLLASSTERDPTVLAITRQLRDLNLSIKKSIEDYIETIQISLQNMSRRERQFNSSIKAIPEKEKIAREIQRQQAVKENLYIFLLQKQVEAALASAITAPTAKVVDFAHTGGTPVSPKGNVIYLIGLVIGLAVPIGILYIMYLFDTKVTSKEQIQAKLDIPIIAEIPVNKEYDGKIIKATDNSNVAESFRILRTNMSYLVTDEKDTDHNSIVIFSTSSTKGEGKTFCAINSASVFASNNHKTLLIGCDLRNPQLHNYLGVSKKNIGLSSYLVDQDLKLNDVIFKTEKDLNFDIILSGEIPPNPSELLNNGRLEELIAEARGVYDYIIVDTAPTMLVTDTLTIVDQADAIIYMIRANFTELKILRHVKELTKFNMKKNVGIAINAVDEKKGYEYNYGYGYGYGIDTKVKKWYHFK